MVKTFASGIRYVAGEESFFCPNLYVISGSGGSLLIDVTNQSSHLEEALSIAERGGHPFSVALTHFHADHISAVASLPKGVRLYCSKNTARHLPKGLPNPITIVSSGAEAILPLGEAAAKLMAAPSLHSKGSMDILYEKTLFVGDALGSREKNGVAYYNREIAVEMEKFYRGLEFREAVQAHPRTRALKKDELMGYLHELVKYGFSEALEEKYL